MRSLSLLERLGGKPDEKNKSTVENRSALRDLVQPPPQPSPPPQVEGNPPKTYTL